MRSLRMGVPGISVRSLPFTPNPRAGGDPSVDGPFAQGSSNRVVSAVAHDRWARWSPRREVRTESRLGGPPGVTEWLASRTDRSHRLLSFMQVQAPAGRQAPERPHKMGAR